MIRHLWRRTPQSFVSKAGGPKNNTSRLLLMDQRGRSLLRADRRLNTHVSRTSSVTPPKVADCGLSAGTFCHELSDSDRPRPKEAKTYHHEDDSRAWGILTCTQSCVNFSLKCSAGHYHELNRWPSYWRSYFPSQCSCYQAARVRSWTPPQTVKPSLRRLPLSQVVLPLTHIGGGSFVVLILQITWEQCRTGSRTAYAWTQW